MNSLNSLNLEEDENGIINNFNNMAIGENTAITSTLTGTTTIGYASLTGNVTGYGYGSLTNTAFGHNTLMGNTNALTNTAIGYNALMGNTNALTNTAIGYNSIYRPSYTIGGTDNDVILHGNVKIMDNDQLIRVKDIITENKELKERVNKLENTLQQILKKIEDLEIEIKYMPGIGVEYVKAQENFNTNYSKLTCYSGSLDEEI